MAKLSREILYRKFADNKHVLVCYYHRHRMAAVKYPNHLLCVNFSQGNNYFYMLYNSFTI